MTVEPMRLLGSTEDKIPKHESCENVSHLEITGILITHRNTDKNNYHQDWRVL